jgi:hypothetical protein
MVRVLETNGRAPCDIRRASQSGGRDWGGKVEGNTLPFCIYGGGTHLFIGCTGTVLPCCADMDES